eukprot:Nk52_evm10s211 gene=Nk52_evmTU10s211
MQDPNNGGGFFGFSTNLPMFDELDDALLDDSKLLEEDLMNIEAEEDAFNDETFGEVGNLSNEWEKKHEELAHSMAQAGSTGKTGQAQTMNDSLDMESAIASIGLDDDMPFGQLDMSSRNNGNSGNNNNTNAAFFGKGIWGSSGVAHGQGGAGTAGGMELLSPAAFMKDKGGSGTGAGGGASSIWSTPASVRGGAGRNTSDMLASPSLMGAPASSGVGASPHSTNANANNNVMSLDEIEERLQAGASAVAAAKRNSAGKNILSDMFASASMDMPKQPQSLMGSGPVPMGSNVHDVSVLESQVSATAQVSGEGGRRPSTQSPEKKRYDNLMKRSEKEFILRCQMAQLQTDNPYLEDFYFQQYMDKKLAASGDSNSSDTSELQDRLKMLLPQNYQTGGSNGHSNVVSRPYAPPKFEGATLGKISASSIRSPRTILETTKAENGKANAESDKKKTSLRNATLKIIENGYRMLLTIEDFDKQAEADKKMAMIESQERGQYNSRNRYYNNNNGYDQHFPAPQQAQHSLSAAEEAVKNENKLAYIHGLFDLILGVTAQNSSGSDEKLVEMLRIRKGRSLVARTLAMLDTEQKVACIAALLRTAPHTVLPSTTRGSPQKEPMNRKVSLDSPSDIIKDMQAQFQPVMKKDLYADLSLADINTIFSSVFASAGNDAQGLFSKLFENNFCLSLLGGLLAAAQKLKKDVSAANEWKEHLVKLSDILKAKFEALLNPKNFLPAGERINYSKALWGFLDGVVKFSESSGANFLKQNLPGKLKGLDSSLKSGTEYSNLSSSLKN